MSNHVPAASPVTVTLLPVTRCQICHRTVAYRPGNLSEVLTGHYRRAHPEAVGLPSQQSATETSTIRPYRRGCLPARDRLAAELNRRTPAVTERGRSLVSARACIRGYGGKSQSADMPSEPRPNGMICAAPAPVIPPIVHGHLLARGAGGPE